MEKGKKINSVEYGKSIYPELSVTIFKCHLNTYKQITNLGKNMLKGALPHRNS